MKAINYRAKKYTSPSMVVYAQVLTGTAPLPTVAYKALAGSMTVSGAQTGSMTSR